MRALPLIVSFFALSNGFVEKYPAGLPPPVPLDTKHTPLSRIVGGTDTTITKWPFVVSLQYEWDDFEWKTLHFCVGTILNKDWILTSGNCYDTLVYANCTVRAGSDHFHMNGTVHRIDTVVRHPQYGEFNSDYDVALIKLNTSLEFSDSIQPVTLPEVNVTYPVGTFFSMPSWGAPRLFDDITLRLQEIDVPTISFDLCKTVYGEAVTERMFCSYYRPGDDAFGMCVGDTGAPAVVDGVVIGIASWHYACSSPGYPNVYANLPLMVDWITEIIGSSSAATATPIFGLTVSFVILGYFLGRLD
ncbi:trypsin-7-like [Athalia rosae]|uniref:trypsin-7-like n=1 Tax=Athalia rosae TaxID=37344 RepID=UPI002033EFE5|nr:trypsin-7-like [Athalia rosae]